MYSEAFVNFLGSVKIHFFIIVQKIFSIEINYFFSRFSFLICLSFNLVFPSLQDLSTPSKK